MTIGELKRKSKGDMKNRYGFAILAMILLNLVSFGAVTAGLFIGVILVGGAVRCCYTAFYVDIARREYRGVDSVYRGFQQFARALVANIYIFLINLAVAFVFGLLFLLLLAITHATSGQAAIIAVFVMIAMLVAMFLVNIKLSFVFYVMNHQTQLSGAECIRASWKLSKGMFWKIVLFNLSFIGWWILVLVTLGGMYLYVSPYYDTARANLYLDAAGDAYGAGNEVSRPAEAA